MLDEKAMMFAALVYAARLFWPKGRRFVEEKLRKLAGNAEVDYETVLAEVEAEQQKTQTLAVAFANTWDLDNSN